MESIAAKRDNELKVDRCKDLIAVIEGGLHPKSIETIVRTIHTLGVEKLCIVGARNDILDILEVIPYKKPLLQTSDPKMRSTFIKTFDKAEDCLEHLEKNGFTSIAISTVDHGRNNLALQEGDFTQKKLAVWF